MIKFLTDLPDLPARRTKAQIKSDIKRMEKVFSDMHQYRQKETAKGLCSDLVWGEADIDTKLELIRNFLLKGKNDN